MSRETMVTRLIGEAYAATDYDDSRFKAMDPRRVKRLANTFHGTKWDNAETLNRLVGAHIVSQDFRREQRTTTSS